MNPMPIGRVCVEAILPSSACAFVRVASRFASWVDSGPKSKPPPMKPTGRQRRVFSWLVYTSLTERANLARDQRDWDSVHNSCSRMIYTYLSLQLW